MLLTKSEIKIIVVKIRLLSEYFLLIHKQFYEQKKDRLGITIYGHILNIYVNYKLIKRNNAIMEHVFEERNTSMGKIQILLTTKKKVQIEIDNYVTRYIL